MSGSEFRERRRTGHERTLESRERCRMRHGHPGFALRAQRRLRILSDRQRRQVNDGAALSLEQTLERCAELLAGFRIAPRAAFDVKVEATRFRGDPQLAVR